MTPRLRSVLIGALLTALIAGGTSTAGTSSAAAPAETQRRSYQGTLAGAEYRVEVPDRWNGTLILYSHGYHPVFLPKFPLAVANREDTTQWLLDHGYALAASRYQADGKGYLIKEALTDQIRLLDWFESNVGHPRRTISYGQSLGATIATLLAERNPRRFDGVAHICGGFDPLGIYNSALDMQYGVKTLLMTPQEQAQVELVKASNPEASTNLLAAAVGRAAESETGRAKLALISSFGDLVGWWNAHEPKPAELEQWIRRQALWLQGAYIFGHGPGGRADLESHAGGNPSWNVGVDYRRQLLTSSQRNVVFRAYKESDADLGADLAALARGTRIAPDPAAVRYMYRWGIPRGTTPGPVITLHTTGDGGAVVESERWYTEQVRRSGDPAKLRKLYVERGAHCSNSGAEEILLLETLNKRLDTGHWPSTSPGRMNALANEFHPDLHKVLDFVSNDDKPMPPAYVAFNPQRWLRPSR